MNDADLRVLKGSYCPMTVPFAAGEIDYEAYGALIARQIEQGSDGILVNATSGEPTTLTSEEKQRLVATAVATANGRVPVCAGTAAESYAESAKLVEKYQDSGADSIVVVTPYYVVPPQEGLVAYFSKLAEATERPLLMYHIPGRAGVRVEVETFKRIRERASNFVGLKNTDTDTGLVHGILEELGSDFRIFAGLEQPALAMLAAGGAGAMLTTANIMPARLAELCRSVEQGDIQTARRINIELQPLFRAAVAFNGPIPVKYMLSRMGVLERAEHRFPMVPLPEDIARRIDRTLDHYGLLPG